MNETETLIQSLMIHKKDLGLTWDIRAGKVTDDGLPFRVAIDGDDRATSDSMIVISMVGDLVKDQRVYVLQTDPTTMYVVGFVNAASWAYIGNITNASAQSGITAEVVSLTLPSTRFRAGRMFRVDWGCWFSMTVASGFAISRVRKGITTGGTVLGASRIKLTSGDSALHQSDHTYFANRSGADVTTSLVFTAQGTTGTLSLDASADTPRTMLVKEIGNESDFSSSFPTL